jgi:protein tyrosine phosphatase (PTP) superfamily phosphohydrolase (DUF442 family)
VRFVAHLDPPRTLEAFHQETGRAGRDGLPAEAWMAYGLSDIVVMRKMLEQEPDTPHRRVLFRKLEALGVRTVVNLRHGHDDRPLLAGTGLAYVNIPCRAWRPRKAQMAAFLKIVRDPARQPVYVHCAQGRDRTGYMVAAYRMDQGWTAEEAIREMKRFRFNRVWLGNPGFLRRLEGDPPPDGPVISPR